MLCVLYKSCLLLATTIPLGYTFTVAALINVADLHIEQADNGKGTDLDRNGAITADFYICRLTVSFRVVYLEDRFRIGSSPL